MPELPEVETIVRRLKPLIMGKSIDSVQINKQKSFIGEVGLLENALIVDVKRRAKIIQLDLVIQGLLEYVLLVHLKMTGQLIFVDQGLRAGGGHPTADWVAQLPSKHTRVVINLSASAQLFFNDQRRFGWIKVLPIDQLDFEYQHLGPDIVDKNLSLEYLIDKFGRSKRPIKQVIMDNHILCGVGNIYACDALNVAKISPFRPADSLTRSEVLSLFASMKRVIADGIRLKGATISDYTDVAGFAGGYQDVRRVYARENEECANCQALIKKEKIAGRGTYYCPSCQN